MRETTEFRSVVPDVSADRIVVDPIHLHPEDVLNDVALEASEKRAILATWMSDRHAMPDQPALRQLENGAVISLDAIRAALQALDGAHLDEGRPAPLLLRLARQRRIPLPSLASFRATDPDDDPPPGGASLRAPAVLAACPGCRVGSLSRPGSTAPARRRPDARGCRLPQTRYRHRTPSRPAP